MAKEAREVAMKSKWLVDGTRLPGASALRDAVREFSAQMRRNTDGPPGAMRGCWDGTLHSASALPGRDGSAWQFPPSTAGGLGALARFVVTEELLAAGAPVAAHRIADRQTAPPAHQSRHRGAESRFLPSIAAGELYTALGLSEPDTRSTWPVFGPGVKSARGDGASAVERWGLPGLRVPTY